jgi:phosphoserine phosphatase
MNRKKLVVLDFDRTLCRIDHNFIFIFFSLHNFRILLLIYKRLVNKISKNNFSSELNTLQINFFLKYPNLLYYYSTFIKLFTNRVLLKKISHLQCSGYSILLASNSISILINEIASMYNFDYALGSTSILNNYGDKKIVNIKSLFPSRTFRYEYLISDNAKDLIYFNDFRKTVNWASPTQRRDFIKTLDFDN